MMEKLLTDSALEFPVIVFSQGLILAIGSYGKLATCTTLGLKRKWYENAVLVDSIGKKYNIVRAERISPGENILKYYLKLFTMTAPYIKVNIYYEVPFQTVTLEDLRALIYEDMKRNPGTHDSAGDIGFQIGKLNKLKTMKEVIEYFY